MLLPGVAEPVGRDRAADVQAPAEAPRRRGRGGAHRAGPSPPGPKPTASEGEGDEKAGPPLLLAERWDNAQDLAGWWLSEKLDGVRAYWDGKSLISRLGNRFHAPDWFLEGLPEIPLDGELWIGRKAFQRTVGIVRRQDKTDLWKEVRYVAFDAPGVDAAFEDRLAAIRAHVERHRPPYLAAHEHAICTGLDHLRAELARVEALGGEGLMLRQPESRYEVGRSLTLLKIKSFRDAEARVLEHLKGAGRHKGRLGALLVELADGTQFSVGTGFSDAEREAPPPVGSVITFRYQELSDGGVPRFPSYVGVRVDAAGTAPRRPPDGPHLMADVGFDRLASSRLILRRLRESDLESFCRYRSDPRVARYQDWESFTMEEGLRVLRRPGEAPSRCARDLVPDGDRAGGDGRADRGLRTAHSLGSAGSGGDRLHHGRGAPGPRLMRPKP